MAVRVLLPIKPGMKHQRHLTVPRRFNVLSGSMPGAHLYTAGAKRDAPVVQFVKRNPVKTFTKRLRKYGGNNKMHMAFSASLLDSGNVSVRAI